MFDFDLIKDLGVTGRLEINIRKKDAVARKKFVKVHSKKGGEGYPADDWAEFYKRLEEAIKNV